MKNAAQRVQLWTVKPSIVCVHCGDKVAGVEHETIGSSEHNTAICLKCIKQLCETLRRMFVDERTAN